MDSLSQSSRVNLQVHAHCAVSSKTTLTFIIDIINELALAKQQLVKRN